MELSKNKTCGYKFRRQHPFFNYILDFYCHALQLAIEVNGPIHELKDVKHQDEQRESHLQQQGLTLIRFTNEEIKLRPEKVLKQIEEYLQSRQRPK